MASKAQHTRVLIYSHDTFGLGHLRRCRAIAHSLVSRFRGLSVLILSGSPIIGSFDFRARVDFVRIPGVVKLRNGDYTSLALHIDIEQTLAIRSSIITHTADMFAPDIFIVDKEPWGLRGEVSAALELLKDRPTVTVLGLRDVLDGQQRLAEEWQRKDAYRALENFYDQIWIYGPQQFYDPLQGLPLSASVRERIFYTGFLKRQLPKLDQKPNNLILEDEYILVTTGGGGDGEFLVDSVLNSYERNLQLAPPVLIVLGPFMAAKLRRQFRRRADKLASVQVLTFDTHLETLIARASGVIAMGGYNTFCEILSFNKRAIIVPRETPRLEQTIRTQQAQRLGLVRYLTPEEAVDPMKMAEAIRQLPSQPLPEEGLLPAMMDGLSNIADLAETALLNRSTPWQLRKRKRN